MQFAQMPPMPPSATGTGPVFPPPLPAAAPPTAAAAKAAPAAPAKAAAAAPTKAAKAKGVKPDYIPPPQ